VLCSTVILAALTVLIVGWFLGVEQLRNVLPGLASMKANTASCFILSGVVGFTLSRGWQRYKVVKILAVALALTVGLVGLITLTEYIFSYQFGIDELLIKDDTNRFARPGRMGPNSAFAFTMTSGALILTLLSKRDRSIWYAQIFAVLGLTVAAVGFIGYIYSAESFGSYASFTPMALHTAVLFILLLIGVLLVRSSQGPIATVFSVYTGGSILRRLLPLFILILFGLGAAISWTQRAGWLSNEPSFLMAVFATVSSVLLILIMWWLSRRLNTVEAARDTMINRAETLESILSSMAEGVVVVDTSGSIELMNEAAYKILKVSDMEDISQLPGYYDFYTEKEGVLLTDEQKPTVSAIMGKPVSSIRLLAKHGDDEGFWVDGSSQPLYDQTGAISGAVTVFHDVDDRMRAQQKIKDQEEFYHTIVNSAADAFVSIDTDGLVTEWNSAAEEVFGYLRDRAVGCKLSELIIPAEMQDAHTKGLQRYLATGEAHILGETLELTAVRSSGEIFPIEIAVFKTEITGVTAFHAFIRDVTERNEIQAEADKAKDEFLAAVSHELRTPLTSVLGYLELLLEDEDKLAEDVAEQLKVVARNAGRLQLLVADLLLVAQLNTRHFETTDSEFDLGDLVNQRVESVKPQLEKKQINYHLQVDSIPHFKGDSDRLGQLLDNLISNAVKYSDVDGTITISAFSDGESATLKVQDDGIGVSEEDQEHLFEQFFRAGTAVKGAISGVGLGLTISKAVVDAHDGDISLTSKEGEGATFIVTLPLKR